MADKDIVRSRSFAPERLLPDRLFGGGLSDLFGSPILANPFMRRMSSEMDEMFDHLMPSYNKTDDGYVYHYNLAGFELGEISVKVDPKANSLRILGEHKQGDRVTRRASYVTALDEVRVSPENITTTYRNGLLTINIKQSEQDTSTFDIPVTGADDADGSTQSSSTSTTDSSQSGENLGEVS